MRSGMWWLVAALGLALAGCGSREEATGPTPDPETNAPPDPGPQPRGARGGEAAGPVVVDEGFELRASTGGPYRAGELGRFGITLSGRDGWHVNQDFPIRVELTAPSGVSFPKPALERPDAAEFGEERARFDVPFTPGAAGEHRVQAKVSFAVCTEENCVPDERTLAVLLPVQ